MKKFTIWTVSAVVCGALFTAPAIASHKPNHNPGGGGGNDATFMITLTDNDSGVGVAAFDGVEGPGGAIQGTTEGPLGTLGYVYLESITTESGSSVQSSYNSGEVCGANENVNMIPSSVAIEDIQVQHNAEIEDITVVIEYEVDGQGFVLLLQGPDTEVFPPTAATTLITWNNRGGGKGKKNRCGSSTLPLSADGVDLLIEPTSP